MTDSQSQSEPWKGVNLGGWLVLEKWITPSLFKATDAVDEYTFCEQATAEDLDRLKEHYKNFITRDDFRWLKEHGITTVRLPVGYWIFGDAAPFKGATEYLDFAMQWAEQFDLKVLIDLHGVPGSQNGKDHSGQKGKISWHKDKQNVARSLQAIDRLSKRYSHSPVLLGIELLNEPHWRVPKRALKPFYEQAYGIIRRNCGDDTWVVMHDGFRPRRYKSVLQGKPYVNVAIDTHRYQTFGRDQKLTFFKHIRKTLKRWDKDITKMGRKHPVIVGEWSLALDGRSMPNVSAVQRDLISQTYWTTQRYVFEQTLGWYYFTYRTEGPGRWNFKDSVEKGVISLDP